MGIILTAIFGVLFILSFFGEAFAAVSSFLYIVTVFGWLALTVLYPRRVLWAVGVDRFIETPWKMDYILIDWLGDFLSIVPIALYWLVQNKVVFTASAFLSVLIYNALPHLIYLWRMTKFKFKCKKAGYAVESKNGYILLSKNGKSYKVKYASPNALCAHIEITGESTYRLRELNPHIAEYYEKVAHALDSPENRSPFKSFLFKDKYHSFEMSQDAVNCIVTPPGITCPSGCIEPKFGIEIHSQSYFGGV